MTRNYLLHILKRRGIINSDNSLHVKFNKTLKNDPELTQLLIGVTSFLRGSACTKTRLHVLLSSLINQPVCKTCSNDVHMRLTGKYRYTFPDYCCSKCFAGTNAVKSKRTATNLLKYGAISFASTPEGQAKMKQTNMERYGVENGAMSDEAIAKRKATNMERYGVEQVGGLPDVVEKRKQTNLVRYGTENAGAAPANIDKRKQTCVEKYGVDNPFKLPKIQEKADVTMLERYGVSVPLQNADIQDKFMNTMVEKYGYPHFHTSQVSPEVLSAVAAVDFWYDAIDKQIPMSVLQSTLNVSRSFLLTECQKHEIEYPVFGGSSYAEKQLVEYIKSIYTGTVLTNTRDVIPPKELDIYIPDLNLAFEYNGVFWHGENQGKDRRYHLNKTTLCNNNNIRLVHILDKEWITTPTIVKSRIRSLLHLNLTIPARKTVSRKLTPKEASFFFNANHIQGTSGSRVCYGLLYENEIMAAMSFGKARYSKTVQWELLRYANKINTTVMGGASKLFAVFKKEYQPTSITTYSDKRWNTGEVYVKLGFTFIHTAAPNYYYFRPSDTTKLYHRSQFQKHKLEKMLDTFNPALTEWANMCINGYDRIWDCGNDVYSWTRPITDSGH